MFGWEIAEPNWDYYEVARCAGGVGGGIAKGPEDFPHGVRIHIEVEDIEKALEAVCHRGAVVVREKMEFADFHLAYFADPTGNGVGLIQNKQQCKMYRWLEINKHATFEKQVEKMLLSVCPDHLLSLPYTFRRDIHDI